MYVDSALSVQPHRDFSARFAAGQRINEGTEKTEVPTGIASMLISLWTGRKPTVGGTVYISVPECGIDGNAKVLAIEACPQIATNPGPGFQIVTGTFQHQAAKICEIKKGVC